MPTTTVWSLWKMYPRVLNRLSPHSCELKAQTQGLQWQNTVSYLYGFVHPNLETLVSLSVLSGAQCRNGLWVFENNRVSTLWSILPDCVSAARCVLELPCIAFPAWRRIAYSWMCSHTLPPLSPFFFCRGEGAATHRLEEGMYDSPGKEKLKCTVKLC